MQDLILLVDATVQAVGDPKNDLDDVYATLYPAIDEIIGSSSTSTAIKSQWRKVNQALHAAMGDIEAKKVVAELRRLKKVVGQS